MMIDGMKKFLSGISIVIVFITICCFQMLSITFAASKNVSVSYDPAAANFTKGHKSVIYIILGAQSDVIAAAKVSILATGGLKIIDVLSPLDLSNKPLVNVKTVDKMVSDKSVKETILVVSSTADLPSNIKIPVIVTGDKSGNLAIDKKDSQVIGANGNTYSFSESKASYITFSEDGKDRSTPPTATPLQANSVVTNLTLRFQGVKPTDVKTISIANVKVQLQQGSGQSAQFSLPQFIKVNMDDAGVWHGSAVFANVKPGKDYAILIKGPKHLQKRICENNPKEEKIGSYICTDGKLEITAGSDDINVSSITLMAGDLGIQDGILNGYDLSFVQNIMRKSSSSSLEDGDINYDGKVNKTDYDAVIYTLKNTSGLDQR